MSAIANPFISQKTESWYSGGARRAQGRLFGVILGVAHCQHHAVFVLSSRNDGTAQLRRQSRTCGLVI